MSTFPLSRRMLLRAGGAMLTGILAGCGSSSQSDQSSSVSVPSVPVGTWPMRRYDSVNSLHNPNTSIAPNPSVDWRASLDEGRGSPLYGAERMYVQPSRMVGVVDTTEQRAVSGELGIRLLSVWENTMYYSALDTETEETGTAAVSTEPLLTLSSGDEQSTPTSTTAQPEVKWQKDPNTILGKRAGDGFYAFTENDQLRVWDAESGDQRWSYAPSISLRDFIITSGNVIMQGEETLVAVDRAAGDEQWTRTPDPERLLDSIQLSESIRDMIDDPATLQLRLGGISVADGRLLVNETNSRYGIRAVTARDPLTGDPQWSKNGVSMTGTTDGLLFSPFQARDASTGDVEWRRDDIPFAPESPIRAVATTDQILVAAGREDGPSDQGVIVAFDQSDGSVAWQLPVDERIWRFLVVNETMYATTQSGTVLAIS